MTPIKIDIDFRFPEENPFVDDEGKAIRQMTNLHIKEFLKLYWKTLNEFVDTSKFDKPHSHFYVLQKPSPEQGVINKADADKKSYFKDGIHIICKDINTIPEVQLLIREQVIKKLDTVLPRETFCICNNYRDIFDKSVIESNGWILHGCRKQNKASYQLKHIIRMENGNGDAIPQSAPKRNWPNDRILIKTLSIRYDVDDVGIVIRDEKKGDWERFLESRRKKNKVHTVAAQMNERIRAVVPGERIPLMDQTLDTARSVELANINWMISMLSSSRSDSYESWIRVAILLFNLTKDESMPMPEIREGSEPKMMPDGSKVNVDQGMWNAFLEFSSRSDKYSLGLENKENWYDQ